MTHTKRERDALLRNSRPTKQMRLSSTGNDGVRGVPQIGDNVFKVGKLARVCSNKGCYELVYVSKIFENGAVEYHCPKHGKRNRQQMDWLDITGSTMIQFRKWENEEKSI